MRIKYWAVPAVNGGAVRMREFTSFLAPQIHEFIRHRMSGDTSYYDRLVLFDRYCASCYPDAAALTQEMVDRWCRQRDTEENNSCRSRISVIRSFIIFLNERGITVLQLPQLPRKEKCTYIPHAFTQDELRRFFDACDHIQVAADRKTDRIRKITLPVFFRLLYSSGMRTVEARLLRAEDVDFDRGIVDIRKSKGSGQHYVVLHDSMLEIMRKYDEAITEIVPGREYFFPSLRNGHFNQGWVDKNFKQLWHKTNHSHATAYDFRHNYAVTNINQWAGRGFGLHDRLVYLSKSMGHCTVESTKYYYSIVPGLSDILDAHTKSGSDWMIPEVPEHEESHE